MLFLLRGTARGAVARLHTSAVQLARAPVRRPQRHQLGEVRTRVPERRKKEEHGARATSRSMAEGRGDGRKSESKAPAPSARRDTPRAGELPPLEFTTPEAQSTSVRTFAAPPLSPGLLEMVQSLLGKRCRPTIPQSQALAHFLDTSGPDETLIAAETGSGKTLAYLLPVLQSLHDARAATEHADYAHVAAGHAPRIMPRSVVLAPTHELARQIAEVAKALSHHAEHKLRVACTSTTAWDEASARDYGRLRAYAAEATDVSAPAHSGAPLSPDVLVATPKRLRELCDANHRTPCSLRNVQSLVVDEADTLFDHGFMADTAAIVAEVRANPDARILFATATIPKSLAAYFASEFPSMATLASPNLHRLPPRLTARFVDPGGSKDMAILKEIFRIFTTPTCSDDQILIFCDRRTSVQQLSAYLRERNVEYVPMLTQPRSLDRRRGRAPRTHRQGPRAVPPPSVHAPRARSGRAARADHDVALVARPRLWAAGAPRLSPRRRPPRRHVGAPGEQQRARAAPPRRPLGARRARGHRCLV